MGEEEKEAKRRRLGGELHFLRSHSTLCIRLELSFIRSSSCRWRKGKRGEERRAGKYRFLREISNLAILRICELVPLLSATGL